MTKADRMEQRFYSCEIRAGEPEKDGGSVIVGRPIVYNETTNLGAFTEVIAPGALDGTNLKDVRLLVNHDVKSLPVARSRNNNGNSTMTLTVDEKGLAIRATLDTENNTDARALYSAIKRGDISGMSFMFSVDGAEWEGLDTDHPTRTITHIAEVLEVSAVTFPAYDATEIQARSICVLDSARAKALDSAGDKAPDGVDVLAIEKEKNRINLWR